VPIASFVKKSELKVPKKMPEASLRVLKEFFVNHLNFTPTAGDILLFERDLAVVSPSLMRASLAEIRNTQPMQSGRARDWREAIYRVYNRKVAEHAQLFPLFHSFETAFRSVTAVTLENHYQQPKWWAPFEVALKTGAHAKTITKIGAIGISTDVAVAMTYMVDDLIRKKVSLTALTNGYELLTETDLSRVGALIFHHWPIFKPFFVRKSVPLSRAHFMTKFDRVRDARNSVYHHKSFAGFTDCYQSAEDLMAYLSFPLERIHAKIAAAKCAPPAYVGLLP
jgi:hypothetical protein